MMASEVAHLRPNETYNLIGGDLFVIVEHETFKVHKYFFDRDSTIFHRRFLETKNLGTADKPIVLEDVTPYEFETFLWVFYNPLYSLYDKPLEDWKVILELAQRWEFDQVRGLALRELAKIDIELVERIGIYQDYAVDAEILLPFYMQLCQREQMPSFVEMQRLGERTAFIIFSARERLRAAMTDDGRSPVADGVDDAKVKDTLETLLRDVPQFDVDVMTETGRSSPSPARYRSSSRSFRRGYNHYGGRHGSQRRPRLSVLVNGSHSRRESSSAATAAANNPVDGNPNGNSTGQ